MIYNGEFIGEKIAGNGVTTALLKRNGLQVISEEQFADNFDKIIYIQLYFRIRIGCYWCRILICTSIDVVAF